MILLCSQLRDCELSPVVNRDLCRRVRSVNGLTHHKPVVRNDIRLSARLIHSLDQKGGLWAEQVTQRWQLETGRNTQRASGSHFRI